jgi:hypothetical protein
MKPTLSPEFYENLYNQIINYGFEPETEDDCHCNMEFEDVNGLYVNLEATFEVNFVDDSFDHAFGTEYGYHFEAGNLDYMEAVTLCTEDDDVSDLFDYDAFFEQFKKREVTFRSGAVIKSGDTVIANYNYNCYELAEFLYRDSRTDEYICKPLGAHRYSRSFKRIFPNTEENRRNAKIA